MRASLPSWTAVCTIIHTASAFYPYLPKDDSDSSTGSKSQRPQAPHTLPLRRAPRPGLAPRDNIYDILNSGEPERENSVAIDQDGKDLSYMVAVTIGSSEEEYHLLLDSAASNTWVMGQECASEACGMHTLFGRGDSDSLEIEDTLFNVTYGTGAVFGNLASDTLHIGSLSPSLTFGLAKDVSSEFKSYPMDGILGIGRSSSSKSLDTPQIMDVLTSSNLIGSKLYGIHLSRASEGTADGELNFGTPNEDRYDGDLNWVDVVDNDTGFWEIELEDAGLENNTMVGFGGITAIIDTGTSFLLLPETDATSLHDFVPGYSQAGEIYTVPCNTSLALQLQFGDTKYNISSEDWVGGKVDGDDGRCQSNVIGRQTFGENQWLVGDVFLKNVYAAFDFEGGSGNGRVGFGVKASGGDVDEEADESSASASDTGPSLSVSQTGGTATPTSQAESQGEPQEDSEGNAEKLSTFYVTLVVAAGILALIM